MTEEYDAASRELRRGVTVFASQNEQAEEPEVETTDPPRAFIRLYPIKFRCIRKSGEVGKDEVYFTWGFGSDQ